MEWFLFGFLAGMLLGVIACQAAYRNGCTDGYGYAREPGCPGYQKAGRYLTKHMAYRWPELQKEVRK